MTIVDVMPDGGDTPPTRQATLSEDWSRERRRPVEATIHGSVDKTVRIDEMSVDDDAERLRAVDSPDAAAL